MMTEIKDGGQAFPHPDFFQSGGYGMTLRDYFAAKAMQTFCTDTEWPLEDMATQAYRMADAMLNARGQS